VSCGRRFIACPLVRLETPSGAGCLLYVAESFAARLIGLAGLAEPPARGGLLLPRCRAVHTLGMRFPIDVVYLSWPPSGTGRAKVLDLRERLSPWRLALLGRGRAARGRCGVGAAELGAGEAAALCLRGGTEVLLRPVAQSRITNAETGRRSRPPG
jgi:uncharacterized protein